MFCIKTGKECSSTGCTITRCTLQVNEESSRNLIVGVENLVDVENLVGRHLVDQDRNPFI